MKHFKTSMHCLGWALGLAVANPALASSGQMKDVPRASIHCVAESNAKSVVDYAVKKEQSRTTASSARNARTAR